MRARPPPRGRRRPRARGEARRTGPWRRSPVPRAAEDARPAAREPEGARGRPTRAQRARAASWEVLREDARALGVGRLEARRGEEDGAARGGGGGESDPRGGRRREARERAAHPSRGERDRPAGEAGGGRRGRGRADARGGSGSLAGRRCLFSRRVGVRYVSTSMTRPGTSTTSSRARPPRPRHPPRTVGRVVPLRSVATSSSRRRSRCSPRRRPRPASPPRAGDRPSVARVRLVARVPRLVVVDVASSSAPPPRARASPPASPPRRRAGPASRTRITTRRRHRAAPAAASLAAGGRRGRGGGRGGSSKSAKAGGGGGGGGGGRARARARGRGARAPGRAPPRRRASSSTPSSAPPDDGSRGWRLFDLTLDLASDPGKDSFEPVDALRDAACEALGLPTDRRREDGAHLLKDGPGYGLRIVRKSCDARKKGAPVFKYVVDVDDACVNSATVAMGRSSRCESPPSPRDANARRRRSSRSRSSRTKWGCSNGTRARRTTPSSRTASERIARANPGNPLASDRFPGF